MPPTANHTWAQAQRSWARGGLSPPERVIAVVAAGQLLRVGLEATGVEQAIYDWAHHPSPQQQPLPRSSLETGEEDTRRFFTVDDRSAQLVPDRTAIAECKRRLLLLLPA
jgi:hypothetical protein